MIESTYWRQELRAELAWLKKNRKYRRWSEKQLVLYERRLMLVAFQVRSLLERPKVNDFARSARMPVVRYKKIGNKSFTYPGFLIATQQVSQTGQVTAMTAQIRPLAVNL